jgi:nucleoid DNA-binding protein
MAVKPKPLKTPAVKSAVSKATTAAAPKKPRAVAAVKLAPVIPAIAKLPQPKPISVQDSTAPITDQLKKKDLIDKVVATTGAKKALVRDIIEATLTVLGDALSKGAMLNLPPFGKAKVSRASDATTGRPMTVKLRRSPAGGQRDNKAAKQALADTDD